MSITDILYIAIFLILFSTSYFVYFTIKELLFFRSKKVFYLGNAFAKAVYYLTLKKIGMYHLFQVNYDKMKHAGVHVAGNIDFGTVHYTVTDLELLKHIMVKDFDHFVNRRPLQVLNNDVVFKKMIAFRQSEQWRALRSKLSPTFSSGKIKKVIPIFKESWKKLVKYIDQWSSPDGEIDLVECFSKFTLDTITSAICGMNSHALAQRELSSFELIGKKFSITFGTKVMIKFAIVYYFPKFAGWMGFSVSESAEFHKFCSDGIKTEIKSREKTGRKRDDFIEWMLEARKSWDDGKGVAATDTSDLLDDDGIVSNCEIFILGGSETTQTLLIFCAYAIAIHPEVQGRLRKEVDGAWEENGGDFTYDSIQRMKYLDMVINGK